MTRQRIRIESHSNVVNDAKVLYLARDGSEVDISDCVTGVDLRLHVGEVAQATLHTILVDGHVTAAVEDVIVKRFRPYRRTMFRRLLRWRDEMLWRLKRRIARSLKPELQRELARSALQKRRPT